MADERMVQRAGQIVGALAIAWIGLLVVVFALRIGFPLELEWMEGGVLHQARRFMHGESVYPEPGAEFVPFLYTPLYAMTLGTLGHVFGIDYTLGRAVSILAWAAIGLGLWRAVMREAKGRVHALVAVGLWCSGYVFAFRWVDLARPDTMFLALTLWALVLLRESWGNWRKAALAGLLMALAFWTKQTAAVFIVASGIAGLVVAPRQIWAYALVIAVVDGLGMLWFDARTEGRLWTYVFELHQAHAFNHERFWRKTWGMFVHAAPFLTVLVLALVGRFVAPWVTRRRRMASAEDEKLRARLSAHRGWFFWAAMALASALVSALGYSTQWAEPNAFLPGVCFGALWIAIALPRGGRAEVLGLALVGAQLVFSLLVEPRYQPIQTRGLAGLTSSYAWQDPSRTIPSAAAKANAAELRTELEQGHATVFALQRPWWSVLAGSDGHVGSMGITDVAPDDRKAIERTVADWIRRTQFDVLWFEGEPPPWLRSTLRGRYHVDVRRQGDARVRPMSGWMSEAGMVTAYTADQVRMVPIAPRPAPQGWTIVADFEDGTIQGAATHGGFGRRPVSGFTGDLPQPAGGGGEFWLASAGATGRLEERGHATIGPIAVEPGTPIVVRLATIGSTKRLRALIVDEADPQDEAPLAELSLAGDDAVFSTAQWNATITGEVRLRLVDDDAAGAIAADDVWVGPRSPP